MKVDYYLATRTGCNLARALINKASTAQVELLYPAVESKDLFYLFARHFKNMHREQHGGALSQADALAATEFAWGCLDNLAQIATAVGCDQSDVWLAIRQRSLHDDYEDNLVIAAALRANAMLVSNDEKLLAHCPVAALNVVDTLAYLEALDSDC